MKDTDIVRFYPPDVIYPWAKKLFKQELLKLTRLFPYATIQQVGSSSIPGAIGKMDVDIQIRVPEEEFEAATEILDLLYEGKHPQLWKEGLAIYDDYTDCVDYLLTIIDSKYDDFHLLRNYLMQHPDDLAAYNCFKVSWNGKPYYEYREAKREFLGRNGETKFLAQANL